MKEFNRNARVLALQLTDEQKMFAERYLEHFNQSRAVREVIKTDRRSTISTLGKQWMNDPNVLEYMEILKEDAAARVDLRLDRVLKEQMRIGFSRMDHFVSWTKDGVMLKGSNELSEDDLAAVQEIVQTETPAGMKIRVKLHPKQPALDQLLKYVDSRDGDTDRKQGDKSTTQKVIQNNVTINGALMDPKARHAIEVLSDRLFTEKGQAGVPKMTLAMRKKIAALTESRLVEYVPPPSAATVDADDREYEEADDDVSEGQ